MHKKYEVLYDRLKNLAEEIEFRNSSPWQLSYAQAIIEIRKLQVEILKRLECIKKITNATPLVKSKEL